MVEWHWWENRSTGRKPRPSVTLSTANLTRTDLRSNPGLRGDRPATNRQSYGKAPNRLSLRIVSQGNVTFVSAPRGTCDTGTAKRCPAGSMHGRGPGVAPLKGRKVRLQGAESCLVWKSAAARQIPLFRRSLRRNQCLVWSPPPPIRDVISFSQKTAKNVLYKDLSSELDFQWLSCFAWGRESIFTRPVHISWPILMKLGINGATEQLWDTWQSVGHLVAQLKFCHCFLHFRPVFEKEIVAEVFRKTRLCLKLDRNFCLHFKHLLSGKLDILNELT